MSTEDGTGIVHIAPSFGADDMRVAKKYGIGALTLVDQRGKFTSEVTDFAGEYVKEDYLTEAEKETEKNRQQSDRYLSVDERIVIKLKKEGKLLVSQKYTHNYPHCWRTDKPILYYPLDSWFIKVTSIKNRMVELNQQINWKPESTGTGRFGNWLENLQDWNLSRSRYWGIPLPIWRSEDGLHEKCIGSINELRAEIEKANRTLGIDQKVPEDLHRPYIDDVILVSDVDAKRMQRESDLIDVWFDSGAMPYAQWGYCPDADGNKQDKKYYPADFIAEGVDQTRGWFYTLHAIGSLVFDSIAFRNVVSNGLVLDKNGEKMSKRKGNVVDPFETIKNHGADATRWYMISNADPWENLKFDLQGITEVRNKFFGTLYNTYSFFAIYANVDQFAIDELNVTELDRWILSKLQNLVREVRACMDDYEPTQAARKIEKFVGDELSNWYVRLSRRRFWKAESSFEKQTAFETLFECLMVCGQLISPIAPFFAEWLYKSLTDGIRNRGLVGQSPIRFESVHLTSLTVSQEEYIDLSLERRMEYAQRICTLGLSLRKSQSLRVRQPLQQILLPALSDEFKKDILMVEDLIKSELNIKSIRYLDAENDIIRKKAKPNFKTLGKKLGKHMKEGAALITEWANDQIRKIENEGIAQLRIAGENFEIGVDDIEIFTEDIPGWLVSTDEEITVALDIKLDDELLTEGFARELINRVQNLRKTNDLNVTDKIITFVESHPQLVQAVNTYSDMIKSEVLANEIQFTSDEASQEKIEWLNDETVLIGIKKV